MNKRITVRYKTSEINSWVSSNVDVVINPCDNTDSIYDKAMRSLNDLINSSRFRDGVAIISMYVV